MSEREHDKTMQGRTLRAGVSRERPADGVDASVSRAGVSREHPAAPSAPVSRCPYCGASVDEGADYCEACHKYIRADVCPFCGARLSAEAAFCPECGNSRGGITCPVCHAVCLSAFCPQCGTALTDEARALAEEWRASPEYGRLSALSRRIAAYDNTVPYRDERDRERDRQTEALRTRVLSLLAKDRGTSPPRDERHAPRRMSADELAASKRSAMGEMTRLLNDTATPALPSPVAARNYAMARRPAGIRVAWLCNYKHALHSSPCGCAKPHLGGKWVVIGGDRQTNDDN